MRMIPVSPHFALSPTHRIPHQSTSQGTSSTTLEVGCRLAAIANSADVTFGVIAVFGFSRQSRALTFFPSPTSSPSPQQRPLYPGPRHTLHLPTIAFSLARIPVYYDLHRSTPTTFSFALPSHHLRLVIGSFTPQPDDFDLWTCCTALASPICSSAAQRLPPRRTYKAGECVAAIRTESNPLFETDSHTSIGMFILPIVPTTFPNLSIDVQMNLRYSLSRRMAPTSDFRLSAPSALHVSHHA